VRIRTVFARLLSLQGAWVRAVEFGSEAVMVAVARRQRRHRCPRCEYTATSAWDRHEREWRHVSLGKWRVVIRATLCRVNCPDHGVLVEAVPWAAHESRFTLDFEDLVAWLAREMNKTAVTRLMHVSWMAVGRIVERVVARKLDKRRLDELYEIGLDEVSYRKGHKYLSIIADHRSGDPVWVGEGRSQETVSGFFDELGPERSKKLKVVSMDMCAPYIAEVSERAPNAQICFDPFHVVKLANEAVHDLRRTEARERKGTSEAAVLKGSRNRRVYRGYLLKEELRALYACGPRVASRHLDAWLSWARRSKLKPFVKLARTVRKYRDGILAAVRLDISNGRLEGLNNKIGVLKHRAYGFHSAAALIAMVFLCCTKLPLTLPI
jgi:transposase